VVAYLGTLAESWLVKRISAGGFKKVVAGGIVANLESNRKVVLGLLLVLRVI